MADAGAKVASNGCLLVLAACGQASQNASVVDTEQELASLQIDETAKANPPASAFIDVELRTFTEEGMLLDAGRQTKYELAALPQDTSAAKIVYSANTGEELFSLSWNQAALTGQNWEKIEEWEALNHASAGEFLTLAGSRPVAHWCGTSLRDGAFGRFGSNPGYFEGFCRLMTSSSLPWDELE